MTKEMKLQKNDIDILKKCGYLDEDVEQIQKAIEVTEYTKHESKPPYKDVKKLTALEAYKLLGSEKFLDGIATSYLLWFTSREYCKKYSVSFNSKKLFE